MLISCPNCATRFSVSDAALGQGRNLKCARCAHKWFQTPEAAADAPAAEPAVVERQPVAEPALAEREREPAPPPSPPPLDDLPDRGQSAFDEPPEDEEDADGVTEAPQPHLGRLDPIPPSLSAGSRFRPGAGKTKDADRGGRRSWLVAGAMLLAGILAGAYAFQDWIVTMVPPSAEAYRLLGLRDEPLGAGLTFRNYSSERRVNGTEETLVVRGVIANTTDAAVAIPALRLTLVDGERIVQEKTTPPPVASLDPGGTVGFRIALERPDPSARRFEVSFAPLPATQP